jgi:hypothetical protein
MPFHVMQFEKRFLNKWFSPQISSKPPSPQEKEHRKREKKKKKEKGKREKMLQESPQIKVEANILRAEKHFNFKSPFWCNYIFSPSIMPFQKPFSKSLRKFS